jgi:hypothetical protein
MEDFPTRESFSEAVIDAFANATNTAMKQWVCCMEKHADGGVHYHMTLKLAKCHRWLTARNFLSDNFGINVNFSAAHVNYYSAWSYVTKEDLDYIESANHPDLTNAPRTMAASQARCRSQDRAPTSQEQDQDQLVTDCVPPSRAKCARRSRMTNFEFSQIVRAKNLKTKLELLSFVEKQSAEGKNDMAEFVMNRSQKNVSEIMETTWAMARAPQDLERSCLKRITILERTVNGECIEGCRETWQAQAEDVLQRNGIDKITFMAAIYTLLKEGRGKYRNLLVTGPSNCGKSFLFKPLPLIYRAFVNPACNNFAWLGIEEAEVVLLNDFRWTSQVNAYFSEG